MAEEQKKSKLENVKESSNFLRGTIAEELARDTQKFSSDDAGLLKFHGTYQQDDRDARKQREAGAGKAGRSYIFMVRTKVPGGKLTGCVQGHALLNDGADQGRCEGVDTLVE